ncbi:DUF1735 domain-containing protein [Fulvivirgaceae bacterium BMA12]|uniref:DUF1735 domain-containing protein n=1 Tax=Agaribacillus aureus TaxID=3051825 RepID=A0ABT8L7L7_9BACT|nr:DUF1735 domain-containing protein [Fulvivirgaceae bacterium BMA12]
MKRYYLLSIIALILFSCEEYEDYVVDTAGYTNVYFPKDVLPRSIVSGEGLTIKVGVYLGGVRTNTTERRVTFTLDNEVLNETSYTPLPSDYFTLSDPEEIVIPEGSFQGLVSIQFDSLKLAADTLLKDFHYALPFRITSAAGDSILTDHETTIIPLKLMNTFEGNFYQVGSVKEFLPGLNVLDTVYVYGDTLDGPKTPLRSLKSIMMDSVTVDGIGTRGGAGYFMKLKVNSEDNSVNVIADPSSIYQVEPNGKSTWNPVKRRFTLSYKYSFDGRNFEVEETLTFRNRVRDGIDEWRWDGFPGN